MFTQNHFIWLGIVILIITSLIIINKKFNLSFNTNLIILLCIMVISESIKIFNNMDYNVEYINGAKDSITGTYLHPRRLPFHLCSIQIFFAFAIKFFIKNDKTKDLLLSFMCPTMIIGGLLAIFIPTEGVKFTNIQTYEYFIYHAVIIYFGIYLLISKKITITFKTMFNNYIFLLVMLVFGIWINSLLSNYATNFLYLARPPMEGLPLLNLNNGWYAYFLALLGIGVTVMLIFHLPFAIYNKIKNKKVI